jgi:hypothetical protein
MHHFFMLHNFMIAAPLISGFGTCFPIFFAIFPCIFAILACYNPLRTALKLLAAGAAEA